MGGSIVGRLAPIITRVARKNDQVLAYWTWRSMKTAISLRWQRLAGRAARAFKLFWGTGNPQFAFSFKFLEAPQRCRADLTRAMGSMPSFRNLMYAYVHAFLEQVLVSGACNGAHSLKQRLARWLLMMHDRGDSDTLQISQTLLAHMLGVQRPSITNAIRELERARLIAPGRQQVTIYTTAVQLRRRYILLSLEVLLRWKIHP